MGRVHCQLLWFRLLRNRDAAGCGRFPTSYALIERSTEKTSIGDSTVPRTSRHSSCNTRSWGRFRFIMSIHVPGHAARERLLPRPPKMAALKPYLHSHVLLRIQLSTFLLLFKRPSWPPENTTDTTKVCHVPGSAYRTALPTSPANAERLFATHFSSRVVNPSRPRHI